MDDASLEIGLQWDRDRGVLQCNLRFFSIDENDEAIEYVESPLTIDFNELNSLLADEQAYGRALTRMVLQQEEVREYYIRARERCGDSRLHLRLHLEAPPRRPLNKAVLGLAARTGQGARCGVRAHAKADIGGKPCPGW